MLRYRKLLVCILRGMGFSSSAQIPKSWKEHLTIDGYIKYLPSTSFGRLDTLLTNNYIHNRINTKWYINDQWTVKVDLRNQLFFGETVSNTPGYGDLLGKDKGWLKLTRTLAEGHSYVVHSAMDRMYIDYQGDKWEARVGRQRINWGINLAWNANDLFNAYNLVDFDYQERPGTDAIRLQYYTGDLSHIELAYQPDSTLDKSILAGLYKCNRWGYDWQLIGGQYLTDFVIGGGWAGSIKNAGFKGEASFFRDRKGWRDTTTAASISLSLDYSFKNGLYANASFLYNSLGSNSNARFNPQRWIAGSLSAKYLMPSKYSYLLQLMGSFNPRAKGNLLLVYGQGLDFIYLMPSFDYEIKSNWSISLIGQVLLIDNNNGWRNPGNTIYLQLWYSY